MGTFCSAAARVVAPVLSTTVFTATANGSWPFPFNYAFVFLCMTAICALCLAVTFLVNPRVNRRKESGPCVPTFIKIGLTAQEREMAELSAKQQLVALNTLAESGVQDAWEPCVV